MNSTKIKDALAAADHAAQQAADQASQLTEDAQDVLARAENGFAELREGAAATFANAKATLADGGDRLAHALRGAADQTQEASARVFDAAASGVSAATDRLRGNGLTELVDSTRDLARRNPIAFAAGAAVVGFALARLLQGSAAKGPRR